AEDGIRDFHVTGVQTCALPISHIAAFVSSRRQEGRTSSTIRRNLASLSSMYSCAISWDWADRNPVRAYDKRMIRENPPRVRYLKIGRASCRDRVETQAGTGSRK